MKIFSYLLALIGTFTEWFPWKKKKAFKPTSTHYHVNDFHFPGNEASPDHRNKLYADQRQKAPHNRRRKPSKRMQHIYKTL